MAPSANMQNLISITEAEQLILSSPLRADTELVSLEHADQRILRTAISADRHSPPFDRVMMDGIAICYDDFQKSPFPGLVIPLSGVQAAGAPQQTLQAQAHAIEVMTGAPLPRKTDCIIPVELYTIIEGSAHLHPNCTPQRWQYIHKKGSDSLKGDALLPPGTILGATELGIAASVGASQLEVSRLPKLGLLTTGDEVIPPDQSPLEHQIRQSHPTVLTSLIRRNHFASTNHTHLLDNEDSIRKAIQASLLQSDILVLTGGVSKGKYDYVAPLLRELLGAPLFHGVLQRPGKPFAYWRTEQQQIFALPGNPVSVLATATRYLLPALRHYLKASPQQNVIPLGSDLNWQVPLSGLIPCQLRHGTLIVKQPRNSGDYTSLANIDGFAQVEQQSYPIGSSLKYYPLIH